MTLKRFEKNGAIKMVRNTRLDGTLPSDEDREGELNNPVPRASMGSSQRRIEAKEAANGFEISDGNNNPYAFVNRVVNQLRNGEVSR